MVVKRFLAFLLDVGFSLLVPVAYAVLFGEKKATGGYSLPGAEAIPVFILIMLYYVLLEAYWGKTLGKRLFNLSVVKVDGSRLTFGDVVIRNSLLLVEVFLCPVIAGIFILTTPQKQRLGDLLAKTKVVEGGLIPQRV